MSEIERMYERKLEMRYALTVEDLDSVPVTSGKVFLPMLAQKYSSWQGECWAQPKLDGLRCVITCNGAFTRNWKPWLNIEHILEELEPLFDEQPDLVLDGELYNHDLHDDFQKITSIVKRTKPSAEDREVSRRMVQFHCYDLIDETVSFQRRSETIENLFGAGEYIYVRVVPTDFVECEKDLDTLYEYWLEQGYEGQMVRYSAPYQTNTRSKNLLKRKEVYESEFPILSIKEGTGNWAGHAKVAICDVGNGKTVGATLMGEKDFCAQVLKEQDEYIGGTATVKYFRLTNDGVPFHPRAKAIYKGVRDD